MYVLPIGSLVITPFVIISLFAASSFSMPSIVVLWHGFLKSFHCLAGIFFFLFFCNINYNKLWKFGKLHH